MEQKWQFSSHGSTMIISTGNNFLVVTRFDSLKSEHLFEVSIVYSKIDDLYIICIYRSPNASIHILFLSSFNSHSLLESLPLNGKLTLSVRLDIGF